MSLSRPARLRKSRHLVQCAGGTARITRRESGSAGGKPCGGGGRGARDRARQTSATRMFGGRGGLLSSMGRTGRFQCRPAGQQGSGQAVFDSGYHVLLHAEYAEPDAALFRHPVPQHVLTMLRDLPLRRCVFTAAASSRLRPPGSWPSPTPAACETARGPHPHLSRQRCRAPRSSTRAKRLPSVSRRSWP